jgi:hypothetical protein
VIAGHPGLPTGVSSTSPGSISGDGLPRSIMVPTSDATLLEDMQELVFARARRAVREIRAQARAAGTDGLTSADIEQEIKEARRTRTGDAGRE